MSGLRVLGAGLGRTGTSSLKLALEDLGYDPCHHMTEVYLVQKHLYNLWKDIADEINIDDALKQVFEGYKAAIDYPSCMHFDKLRNWNPDAKVILTLRDSPEAWATSCRNTIFKPQRKANYFHQKLLKSLLDFIFPNWQQKEPFQNVFKCISRYHGADVLDADTDLVKFYSDWKKHVIATVPADKLLIFNVKEGWEPLCKFLEVPVPGFDFPKSNSTKQYQTRKSPGIIMPTIRALFLTALVGGMGVLAKFCYESYW